MQESKEQSPLIENLLGTVRQELGEHRAINRLCDVVRQTSFDIHKFFRSEHLERVYENALAHRLGKLGIHVIQQYPLDVCDEDGTLLSHFCADLFIDNELVVEIKACRCLIDDHVAQLLGYLRASRKRYGLLINFGGPKLQIKKYILDRDF